MQVSFNKSDKFILRFNTIKIINIIFREINHFSFSALQVVKFLNKLYMTMDKRMDNHDVYKVETISDQYLVVSGVPKKNGNAYVEESIYFINLNLSHFIIEYQKVTLTEYINSLDMLLKYATWLWI